MNRDADITYLLSESMETRRKARKMAAIALIAAIKGRRALDEQGEAIASEVALGCGSEAGREVRSLCRALGYPLRAEAEFASPVAWSA
jgi:hypothetical protein